jgi:hypothetical protein
MTPNWTALAALVAALATPCRCSRARRGAGMLFAHL